MSNAARTPITVAHGDGIGPEIMAAVLAIMEGAGARLEVETIQIGEQVYKQGVAAGIAPEAWESLRRTKIFLKAPITTPQGGGVKSLNVTIRKTFGLFANVRPVSAYAPFVATHHPKMDLVIVRENEEDLYAGIEHRQTQEVTQCLKLISRPGTDRIIRYAFDYARQHGRSHVTCMTKDNIMKITDGLFHKRFDEIGAAEYPEIGRNHKIIDIGAALLAEQPERFDVILAPNLYGDILSDIAAQVAGSVGLAGSANIGEQIAMFEAVHGSAPDIAGQDIANPSGLLQAAVMMLVHIGQADVAERIQNAWLCTIEDGIHTGDIYKPGISTQRVGTRAFAQAVIERLGQLPRTLKPVTGLKATTQAPPTPTTIPREEKLLVGADLFLDWDEPGRDADALARKLLDLAQDSALHLQMITNRGVKVWPAGDPNTFCTDHWRCRFMARANPPAGVAVTHRDIIHLLTRLTEGGIDVVKTEHLYTFNGSPGFSLGQGQ
jgi:isocitrate dehydrogenase